MAAVAVSQVVDSVLAAVDSDAGPELVAGWCSERLRELTNRARFRHLLRLSELIVPATIGTINSGGTVTVTNGSRLIVPDATALAAWQSAGAAALTDRFFRIDGQRNWFHIVGFDNANLLLETHYVAPFSTASSPIAGAGYKISKRYNALAQDLRHIGVFSHQRLLTPLEEITHQELDLAMSGRVLVADIPRYWAEVGTAPDGRKLVEIYPYARTEQLIRYSYHVHSPALTLDSLLPDEVDLHILKTGVLVDVHRWEMSRALRANQPEAAATWRNEMNTLVTRWGDAMREAVKQDRASDALGFQMMTSGFPSSDDRRTRNAYDYVWQKGNRP